MNQSRKGLSSHLSPFPAEFIIRFFNQAAALATVFLIIRLGWDHASVFMADPLPMLMALLCFFHVMVYWINFHHFIRFSDREFSIAQTWTVVALSLGLVFYPISLTGWIEADNHLFYGLVNCYLTFLLVVLNQITSSNGGSALYRIYRAWAPRIAFAWYLAVVLLSMRDVNILWMIWTAPFFFAIPLGAAEKKNIQQPTATYRAKNEMQDTER